MASGTGQAGVIVASDDANSLEKLVHSVLDDLLYNIVHDLLLKTHRDEKMARANSAAIRVEKLASDASESSTPDSKSDVKIETEEAIFADGRVLLKGNPLKNSLEVLCPRCRLPRLLYPTDGKGARKPDPSIIYCKKHPYIEKPGFDIYGQTWVQPGPGRGKKKKDVEKKLDGKTDSPGNGTPGPEQRPANVLSYPSATCSKCKRCILVTRLNNHMGSCIGNSGRNASRAAAQKISNGNGHSQGERTPPSSQKGTPLPGSRSGSPRKRDSDELFDDGADDEDPVNPKKKLKPAGGAGGTVTKKVILKTKAPLPTHHGINKKDKGGNGAASLLGQEQRADELATARPTTPAAPVIDATPPKKSKPKIPSPAKKLKLGAPIKPPKLPLSSPMAKPGRERDAASESSGTLSSPPQ